MTASSERIAVGSEIELRIDALVAGGEGIGRHQGFAVFVPRTAPGDRVLARIVQGKKRWARAERVEVLEPGRARREAPCPYYGACGGCSWLHVDERAQSEARLEITRSALERLGGFAALPALESIESPVSLGYRARARVAHDAGRVGFRARGSHEVVDIERCLVLDERTQAALAFLRAHPRRGAGEVEIRGFADSIVAGGHSYHVSPGVFVQANGALWDRWLDAVLEACGSGGCAVELYAGMGFYTAALERNFASVVAVERGRGARDARRNTNARVIDASVDDWAPRHLGALSPDLVLLNPPRTGCTAEVIEAIRACSATRIVYVSCEPATLARDLARLGDDASIERILVMDALPQTHHVEVIAVIARNPRNGC